MSTIGERLKEIRKAQPGKLSQEMFAQKISLKRSAYMMYEMDKVIPTDAMIKLICQTFHKNERWLKTGEGDPDVQMVRPLHEEIADIMQGEDPFKIATMTSLAQMPPEWWEAWSAKLHELIEQKKTERG